MSKKVMRLYETNGVQKYVSKDLWVMKREQGKTPNGNELGNRWVLRNDKGEWIDFDQYRFDLAERNCIELLGRSG